MNAAAEFTAALPEPRIILGLKLLPLSLGRYRLLKRFDCPFIADEEREIPVQDMIGELVFALVVCGLPCSEFNDLVVNGGLEGECRKFGKVMAKVISKTKNFSIYESMGEFKIFLEEAQSTPWHVVKTNSLESESVSHWSHSIEVTLRSRVGWTKEEIEEQPMQKALCDFFKFVESEGAVRLMSHEAHSMMMDTGEANGVALMDMMKGMNN